MSNEGGKLPMDQHLSKNAEEWRDTTLRQAQTKTPQRQKKFVTSSNIEVPDLPTEEDLRNFDPHTNLGYPGEFPFIIAAVEAYATLGEVSDAMRHVFGEQREFRSAE